MIYVTGDLHGDIKAFKKRKLHRLKKEDKLIVTGDFGFVFDDSEEEIKKRNWLKKQKCEILFVDGAHDNHSLIETFETVELYGSLAKHIEDNIYCLTRGEVYTIEDKTIFAFGSGLSENYLMKEDPDSLFILPTMEEMRHGTESLKKFNNEVDFVVTYDAPAAEREFFRKDERTKNHLHTYLDGIANRVYCKKWYFGHYHTDRELTRTFTAIYEKVRKIGE